MSDFRSIVEQIRTLVEIVEIIGSRIILNGSNKAICPFHEDRTPSLSVKPEGQYFYCFGCGAGGDVFKFLQFYEKKSFYEAVEMLGDQVGVKVTGLNSDTFRRIEAARLKSEILDETVRFYQVSLTDKVLSHLTADRVFTLQTIQRFRIGYARGGLKKHLIEVKKYSIEGCIQARVLSQKENEDPKDFYNNRIIFPNMLRGQVVHLTGRSFYNSVPKYLHLPGKIQHFYNEDALENEELLVVEGPTDCIAAQQAGFPCIALLGSTGLRADDKSKFDKCKRVFICLDADASGRKGAKSAAIILGERAKIVSLPDRFDVCDFLQKSNAGDIRKLLDSAKSQVEIELEAIPADIDKVDLPDSIQPTLETLATYSEPKIEAYLTHKIKSRFGLTDEDVKAYRNQLKFLAEKVTSGIKKSDQNHQVSVNPASLLTTIDCHELLSRNFNEPELVPNGILSPARTLLIIGAPKSGKTILALNLAVALSEGSNWLGFDIPEPQNVLYLSAEGGPALLQSRISKMIDSGVVNERMLTFWWPEKEQVMLDDSDSQSRLIATIVNFKVSVFIIDPLIRFHSADENNAKEMSVILKNLELIRTRTKAATVIVHHSRKTGMSSKPGSAQEARGSSVLLGDVDSVAVLEQDRKKGEFKIDFTLRWAPEPDTLKLALNEDTLTFEVKESDTDASNKVTDKKLLAAIKEMGECTTNDLIKKTGIKDWDIRRRLNDLEIKGLIIHQPGGRNSKIWSCIRDENQPMEKDKRIQ